MSILHIATGALGVLGWGLMFGAAGLLQCGGQTNYHGGVSFGERFVLCEVGCIVYLLACIVLMIHLVGESHRGGLSGLLYGPGVVTSLFFADFDMI